MINMTASGNLGRDPELKNVGETVVANFSIGCRTGQDETTWVNCAVWGKRATTVMKFMTKGSRVTVAGAAKVREFEAKDGTPGKALEMNVSDFTLPEKQADSAPAAASATRAKQTQEDEIPF